MRHRRKHTSRISRIMKAVIAAAALLVLVAGIVLAQRFEECLTPPVESAGQQLTYYSDQVKTAQVFMNGQWYQKKAVETILVIGVDHQLYPQTSSSYTNKNQADFLALFVHDKAAGSNALIHINRDTMATIPVLGVTGEETGTRYAQLALAYNYGQGGSDSGRNTVKAVSHLMYGAEVDHYITLAMDAVPILNDWVGGVTVEIKDDFSGIDAALVQGSKVKLQGQQALTFVRSRYGVEDGTNLQRMERQRTYASSWFEAAQPYLNDQTAATKLVLQLSDHHDSDCTAGQLAEYAALIGRQSSFEMYELIGEAVRGDEYMEYYVDEAALQQLVLELFYEPV